VTALQLHAADNVAVMLTGAERNSIVSVRLDGNSIHCIELLQDIPIGHKFAVTDIQRGEEIRKYGYPMGVALAYINQGEHVHINNVKSARF
jgi:altronate dehydratase